MLSKVQSHKNKIFIIFLLFFSIIFNQYYGNLGAFPIDSFLHFDAGYRILKGDHPFKDYWTMAAPLVDYLQAFFFCYLDCIGKVMYYMHLLLTDF